MPYLNGCSFSTATDLDDIQRVFIEGNQLLTRWQALPSDEPSHFVIADTTFGSGLRFLLTWVLWQQHAPSSACLHYISCDKYPLTRHDLARCLARWPQLHPYTDCLLSCYPVLTPGIHPLQLNETGVHLTLMLGDALASFRELLVCGDVVVEQQLREWHVDAWFLTEPIAGDELFMTMGLLSKKNATLASLSGNLTIKRGLQAAGFVVDFDLHRDRLLANFVTSPVAPTVRHTPWHVSVSKPLKAKRALVLGAGLAGCYTAHALARRGWHVTLIDSKEQVGQGASGNQHAILYPKLSAYRSPLTAFMLSSFLFATSAYKRLLTKQPMGELLGILQLAYNSREKSVQAGLRAWLQHYPELGRLVDADEATCLTGMDLALGGLYIPLSGWFDAQALCQLLLQTPGIHWVPNTSVTAFAYENSHWHIEDHHAEVLVVANGYQAAQFEQTAHLPLNAVHGQMTTIASNEQSLALRIPLCADGHILPARSGMHGIGATYNPNRRDSTCDAVDDALNLAKMSILPLTSIGSNQLTGHWAGVRGATPDYLPLVGSVPNAALFTQRFGALATDSKRWIPLPGSNYPGLYMCAGFGSRGLTTIPLSASWLAAMISQESAVLPRTMIQSLSPARFLRRKLICGK